MAALLDSSRIHDLADPDEMADFFCRAAGIEAEEFLALDSAFAIYDAGQPVGFAIIANSFESVLDATRALLWIETPAEATSLARSLVEMLGGILAGADKDLAQVLGKR